MRRVQILDGDTGTHGGFVRATNPAAPAIRGADGVLRRKASLGDMYDCPIHGPVPITSGSGFVYAGTQAVACEGDSTACGATLIAQAWAPVEEDGATPKQPKVRSGDDKLIDLIIDRQSEPSRCATFSRLLRQWRDNPGFEIINGNQHKYVDNKTVTMDWILRFKREEDFVFTKIIPLSPAVPSIDQAIPWLNTRSKPEKASAADEQAILLTKFNPELKINQVINLLPDDITSNDIRQSERGLIWFSRRVRMPEYLATAEGASDCLTMALANFSYRAALSGTATLIESNEYRTYKVYPKEILLFAQDSFSFEDDQFLGFWNQETGDLFDLSQIPNDLYDVKYPKIQILRNIDFRNYRIKHKKGRDYMIITKLIKHSLWLKKDEDFFICKSPASLPSPQYLNGLIDVNSI